MIHEFVDGIFDGHEDLVAQPHLLGQHVEQSLLAVGQPRVREPARLADKLVDIWWKREGGGEEGEGEEGEGEEGEGEEEEGESGGGLGLLGLCRFNHICTVHFRIIYMQC